MTRAADRDACRDLCCDGAASFFVECAASVPQSGDAASTITVESAGVCTAPECSCSAETSLSPECAPAKAALQEPLRCVGLPAQQLIVQVSCADERVSKGATPARSASASIAANTIRVMKARISLRCCC
jgi:hypothetical protein